MPYKSEEFGKRLRRFMKEAGLSRKEFAQAVGEKDSNNLSVYLNGSVPDGYHLFEWSKVLCVSVEDFFVDYPSGKRISDEEYLLLSKIKSSKFLMDTINNYFQQEDRDVQNTGDFRGGIQTDLKRDRGHKAAANDYPAGNVRIKDKGPQKKK